MSLCALVPFAVLLLLLPPALSETDLKLSEEKTETERDEEYTDDTQKPQQRKQKDKHTARSRAEGAGKCSIAVC